MVSMAVELYTDGSCLKNPGPGAYAFIIKYFNSSDGADELAMPSEITESQGFRLTTNNRMEILAAVEGINYVLRHVNDKLSGIQQLNVFSDSEYLCKAINQRWLDKWSTSNWMTSGFGDRKPKAVKNKDLWERILKCQADCRASNITLTFNHVNGHAGNTYNERCDKMAVDTSSNPVNQLVDEEYEKFRY